MNENAIKIFFFKKLRKQYNLAPSYSLNSSLSSLNIKSSQGSLNQYDCEQKCGSENCCSKEG